MQPICIITPTGMICSASPLKAHRPSGKDCKDNFPHPQAPKAERVREKIKEAGCTPDEEALIGRVAELLLAAAVTLGQPFSIVYPGEAGSVGAA
jgi:hypothetical protein